jgi:hypothetical protein
MTDDTLERLAREAGMLPALGGGFTYTYGAIPADMLARFAALVRADALEQAAKVCEAQEYQYWRASEDQDFTPQDCADAIRALKDTP